MIDTFQDDSDKNITANIDIESNYGSDLGAEDEVVLAALLTQAETQDFTQVKQVSIRDIEDGIVSQAISRNTPLHSRQILDEDGIPFEVLEFDGPVREATVEVEYDARNRVAFSPKPGHEVLSSAQPVEDGTIHVDVDTGLEEPDPDDNRSPLERFKKRRPLSVTNIVSPAWCELQYWYNLTKYGRVRRTKAMEQGSSVHKVMEEQTTTKLPIDRIKPLVQKVIQEELKHAIPAEVVAKVVRKILETETRTAVPVDVAAGMIHKVLEKENIAPVPVNVVSESVHKAMGEKMRIAVSVDVTTKEDAFGLRIWNTIQGLRTLRATGIVREVEVWAVVQGEVVNGVIDELSYECPDEELEAKIIERQEKAQNGKRKRKVSQPPNQRTLQSYFSGQSPSAVEDNPNLWLGTPQQPRKVYLADIKTRGSKTVPSSEVSLRPTAMQLMMYHRMLTMLASNAVPADQIFKRYNLESIVPLSDDFIAQVGSLDLNIQGDLVEDTSILFENEQDAIDELLAHNTLEKLWTLLMSEFARTIPFTSSTQASSPIGDVLRAEYRASGSGTVIGTRTFAYDASALDTYVEKIMAWWRGERMPKGVDVDEAFKCRLCEFSERCTWRKEKVDESLRKANKNRLSRQERRTSEI